MLLALLLPLLGLNLSLDPNRDPVQPSTAPTGRNTAFGSHAYHSEVMYYPMRSMRDGRFRLIHNLIPHSLHPTLWDFLGTDVRAMAFSICVRAYPR